MNVKNKISRCLIVYLLGVLSLFSSVAFSVTEEIRVSSKHNDAEELISDGNMYRDSSDLELGYDDYAGGLQIVGMRFQSVNIPQGATINSAYIEFETDETDSGATNLVIFGENNDSPNQFANNDNNISDRTKTSASVNWTPSVWNSINELHQTPDISTIIQEIVNRANWAASNNLVLIVEPGSGCTTISCQRTAESHDGESNSAPLLVINYTVAPTKLSVAIENVSQEYDVSSYGGSSQDRTGTVEIRDAGLSLYLEGNRWQKINFPYTVTADTVIEFDFQSTVQGEIQGLGFDDNLAISANRSFRVYGTQDSWGLSDFDTYSGSGVTHFIIPVGDYYTGNFQYLFFMNDDDSNPTGNSLYSNINVYEKNKFLAEYRFDEPSWAGDVDEVVDETGNFSAQAVNGALTKSVNPAIVGNPGTCGYGSFDGKNGNNGDYIALPDSFENLTDSFTVTAWINPSNVNSGSRILIDDEKNTGGFGFSLGDPGNGKLRFYSRNVNPVSVDTTSSITSDTWTFVAAVHNSVNKTRQIFINGVAQTITGGSTSNTYTGNWGEDDGPTTIGGETNSGEKGNRFTGDIDEVRVYKNALTESEISAIYAETHACGDTPVIHHYEISHDGQGLTCEAESVTIKAHDLSHNLVAPSASTTITLSTSITNDGWTLKSDNGSFNAVTEKYTFDGIETQVEFGLSKTTATASPHINIGVTDGTSTDLNGDITEDKTLAFADTGFRFLVDNNSIDIPTQLSGKPSNTGYNTSNLSLQAIKTSTVTGACEAAFLKPADIELVAECIDPIACAGKKVLINSTPINTQEDVATSSSYTPVSLDFGSLTNNTARFDLTYPDAGKIQLHARYNIPVGDSPSGVYMKGSSNSFVVRPFGFSIAVEDANSIQNPAAVDHNGTVFMSAGDIFTTNLTAVQWKTGQDSNNDGIPDDTDNITSNLFTPNFGNEITPETADITHALYLPKPATLGDLSNNSFNFINGIASNNNMTYSEVGIISFTANLNDNAYLTANDISGNAPYVGRFTPENFALSVDKEGSFVSVCEGINIDMPFAYNGQMSIVTPSKGVLRYLEQPEILITPKSKLGNHTKNYTGDFNKLTLSGVSRFMIDDGTGTLVLAPIEDTTQVGVNANKVRLTSNFDDGILTEGENENVGILSFQYNDLDNFFYLHEENSEIIPFTSDINLAIASIIDGDAVTAIDADGIGDTGTASDTVITLNPSGKEIRFGRVYLANSFGPETSDLPQPFFVQYLDAVDHYKNTVDDTCTAFDSSKITLTTIDFDKNKTGVNTVSGHFFTGETREIELLAPSDGSDGIRGNVSVEYNIYPWLEYHWDWNGTGPKLYDNPSAVATFGLFRGNDRIIFQREVFH